MDKQHRKALTDQYKERPKLGGVCAIRCARNGKQLLSAQQDIASARNKFAFFTSTGACPELLLTQDWAQYGRDAFSFEVIEELEKKPEQAPKEFRDDLDALLDMWREKLGAEGLY